MLNNYIGSAQSQIHELLQSIEKLPGLSNQLWSNELPQSIAPVGLSKDEILKTLVSIETAISDLSEAATERAKELEVVGNDSQKKLSKMIDNISKKYQGKNRLNDKIKEIDSELASVKAEQELIQKEAEDLTLEYNQIQEEYNQKTRDINIGDLQVFIPFYGLYYAGKRAYDALDAALSSLKDDIQQKQNELENLNSRLQETYNKKDKILCTIETLEKEIKKLEQEQEKLESKNKEEAKWVVKSKDIVLNCQKNIRINILKFKRETEDAYDAANDLESCEEDLIELKKSMEQLLDSISELHIMVYNV